MDPFRPVRAPSPDATALLLGALAWICADDDRANRLLAVTGLDSGELRARATDPAVLVATGQFLADHEPDLIACARALDCLPLDIVEAVRRLGGE
jgi:hypothetical protein